MATCKPPPLGARVYFHKSLEPWYTIQHKNHIGTEDKKKTVFVRGIDIVALTG